jgi:lysophospholipase L1-like esterase
MRTPRVALALAACAAALPAAAQAAPISSYVALGDSYTSGAGILPLAPGAPLECSRSTRNYPHEVANDIAPGSFADASCGGATTVNMTQPQSFGLETNPPQFNSLTPNTDLVTVGIGGNDLPFSEFVIQCGALDPLQPTGSPCKNHYTVNGVDTSDAKIAAVVPKLAAVIQGIHARSPQARVLVVGYPDILPASKGCWPILPISSGDVPWLDGLEQRLNAMIAQQAQANGAEYVDTYTSSVGHDVCKAPGTKWVEGLIPTDVAAPVHPNALGEANMARQVEGAL